MKQVRLGVIGLGNMGSYHVAYMHEVPGVKLAAIADRDPRKLEASLKKATDNGAKDVRTFAEGGDLVAKADVDAIIIAVPHYDHPVLTLAGFKRGLHVLTEKPVAVTAAAAQKVNDAYKAMKKKPVYAAMFNQRTNPTWRQVKQIVSGGELGEVRRVVWLITNWFRSQAYYNSGGWRATWAGEGGGVLINQCPHNLDLIQWFVGMPSRVTALAYLGKHHNIEVEDDVTAMLEYPNGATGVFITSTGEAPGTNRLEIVGDRGKLVTDGKSLELWKTHESVRKFADTTPSPFSTPTCDYMKIEAGGTETGHKGVTTNFINAILHGEPLIAQATEGINGLELGNAMLYSGLTGKPVAIPTPRAKFEQMLKDLAKKSKAAKKASVVKGGDFTASFGK
ncbi:MAG: Gfo/Idh/MocA family protein [Phycisphaerales bacterium]